MKERYAKLTLWLLYSVLWIGGTGGHLLSGGTPPDMRWTAPVFLLLAASLVAFSNLSDLPALALSCLLGFIAESVGVATGYPFGSYTYTAALAPSVLGVPLAVAGAWMVLIAWVRQLTVPIWAGALLMTLFDLVIDPLAANTLGYWHWLNGGPYYNIPLTNFGGWYLVSAIILALLRDRPPRSPETVATGCSILIFFALIGLAHRFYLPAAAGILIAGFGYWRWRSSSVSTTI